MTPYGCHSQPRESGYWASHGTGNVNGFRFQVAVWVFDDMSKTCQYRKDKPTDPRCEGCTCE